MIEFLLGWLVRSAISSQPPMTDADRRDRDLILGALSLGFILVLGVASILSGQLGPPEQLVLPIVIVFLIGVVRPMLP